MAEEFVPNADKFIQQLAKYKAKSYADSFGCTVTLCAQWCSIETHIGRLGLLWTSTHALSSGLHITHLREEIHNPYQTYHSVNRRSHPWGCNYWCCRDTVVEAICQNDIRKRSPWSTSAGGVLDIGFPTFNLCENGKKQSQQSYRHLHMRTPVNMEKLTVQEPASAEGGFDPGPSETKASESVSLSV